MRLTRDEYSNHSSALRQTLRHLVSLEKRQFLTRLERRVGGCQGGSTVSIWTLTTKGQRHLTGQRARRRPHHISTTFLGHLLAVSETRVIIHETAAREAEIQVQVVGEPSCWRHYIDNHGTTTSLKPDLSVTVSSSEFVDRYFIEVDRATENPARVIGKCWHYVRHRRSGHEQEHHGVYPAVVWLAPHLERKAKLERAIASEPKLPAGLFTVITPHELAPLIRNGPGAGISQGD